MHDDAPHPRTIRPEVLAAREASEVVRPLQHSIHDWQVETAQLLGLAEKAERQGAVRPANLDRALLLSRHIASARLALDKQVATLPPAVARSPRLVDTARAMDGIAGSVERAIGLLRG